MPVERSCGKSRSRHAVLAWLLGALLVLQLAAPGAGMARPPANPRLAALAKIVGHAVATCDHDDGQMPAGDAGPCCPCTLCHALALACPAGPLAVALDRPVAAGTIATYPQPPPRATTVLLGSFGPRGPPLVV